MQTARKAKRNLWLAGLAPLMMAGCLGESSTGLPASKSDRAPTQLLKDAELFAMPHVYLGGVTRAPRQDLLHDPLGDSVRISVQAANASKLLVGLYNDTIYFAGVEEGETGAIFLGETSIQQERLYMPVTVLARNRRPYTTIPQCGAGFTLIPMQGAFGRYFMTHRFTDPERHELTYVVTVEASGALDTRMHGDTLFVQRYEGAGSKIWVRARDPGGLETRDLRLQVSDGYDPEPAAIPFANAVQFDDPDPRCDGTGGVGTNRPPKVIRTPRKIVLQEGPSSHTEDMNDYFGDPDDDKLEFTAVLTEGSVRYTLVDSLLTVATDVLGTATITVTATDPGGLSVDLDFEVVVAGEENRPPQLIGTPRIIAVEEGASSHTENMNQYFADPDGDKLEFTAVLTGDSVRYTLVASLLTVATDVAGRATITVTATDPGGLSVDLDFEVIVVGAENRPPQVVDVPGAIGLEEDASSHTENMNQYFADPDDDKLEFTAVLTGDSVRYTLVDSLLTVATDVVGTATITVTATDPGGLSVDLDFEVVVGGGENRPPQVVGTPGEIRLEEDASSITEYMNQYFADPDDDKLEFTAVLTGDSVRYTLVDSLLTVATDVVGTATITVTATDPGGLSVDLDFEVVVVEGENRPPQVVGTPGEIRLEEDASSITEYMNQYFADPDDDKLEFTAVLTGDSVRYTLVDSLLTVATDVVGTATITVTATDPGGLSVDLDFEVVVVEAENRPPQVVDVPGAIAVEEGASSHTENMNHYFADPDDDKLEFTAVLTGDSVRYTLVDSLLTVATDVVGTATITVTATDPGGLSVDLDFEVVVVGVENRPPQVVGTPEEIRLEEDASSITEYMNQYFVDPDGDKLEFTAVLTGDSVSYTLVDSLLTVATDVAGRATITVTATDPGGLSVDLDFEVVVVGVENRPPEVVGTNPLTVALQIMGGMNYFEADMADYFRDPDGDPLSYAEPVVSMDVAAIEVELKEGILNVDAAEEGQALVTVTATDTVGGESVSMGFLVTVTGS